MNQFESPYFKINNKHREKIKIKIFNKIIFSILYYDIFKLIK